MHISLSYRLFDGHGWVSMILRVSVLRLCVFKKVFLLQFVELTIPHLVCIRRNWRQTAADWCETKYKIIENLQYLYRNAVPGRSGPNPSPVRTKNGQGESCHPRSGPTWMTLFSFGHLVRWRTTNPRLGSRTVHGADVTERRPRWNPQAHDRSSTEGWSGFAASYAVVATMIRLLFDAHSTTCRRSLRSQRRNPLTAVTLT